jgi:hypothetical protein
MKPKSAKQLRADIASLNSQIRRASTIFRSNKFLAEISVSGKNDKDTAFKHSIVIASSEKDIRDFFNTYSQTLVSQRLLLEDELSKLGTDNSVKFCTDSQYQSE